MAYGDITEAVIDTLIIDSAFGSVPSALHIQDNVYAVAYQGPATDGWVKTFCVDDDGTISNAIIGSLEFDTVNGAMSRGRSLVHVSGTTYAIVYKGPDSDGFIVTVSISGAGVIGNAVLYKLEYDTSATNAQTIIHVSGSIFAIFYKSSENGFIKTVSIAANGTISSVIDSFDMGGAVDWCKIINHSGDIFLLAHDDKVHTITIDSSGNIGAALISSLTFTALGASYTNILQIAPTKYAVTFRDGTALQHDGHHTTFSVDGAGAISSAIDTYEFSGDLFANNTYNLSRLVRAVVYGGAGDNGHIETRSIDLDGNIATSRVDEWQFDNDYCNAPVLLHVSDNVYLIIYQYVSSGAMKAITLAMETEVDGIYVWLADTYEIAKAGGLVFGCRTERGRDEELGHAASGVCELTCDNYAGDFSPELTSGSYYGTLDLGAKIEVYEIYKGIAYNHFLGKIDKIVPHAEWDNRLAYILAVDGMDDMAQKEIDIALLTDTTTDALVDDVLDAINWGASARDLDTGIDTLQVAWFHKENALEAIQDLELMAKGFFYIDIDGKAIWENRHARVTGQGIVSQGDFEDTMVELSYEFSKRDLKNWARVTGYRYTAEADDTELWSIFTGATGAPYIPPASDITIWADLAGPLYSYDTLVEDTHWNANTAADKTGTDVGTDITITVTQYGQALKFLIENAGAKRAYLVVPDSPPTGATANRTLIIFGKLYLEDILTVVKEDTTSRDAYGPRSIEIDARFKSNPNDILAYADYLIARFKDPIPTPSAVKLVARTSEYLRLQCLGRKISDRVTLKSTLLGFDRDFYIDKIIQDYVLHQGGTVHETTWYVTRASGTAEGLYWLLATAGFGELGETTVLGF